jgi:hypothetical protein
MGMYTTPSDWLVFCGLALALLSFCTMLIRPGG